MKVGEAESELRWYFRESAGELGLRSSFSSMVARLEGVYSTRIVTEMDPRRLGAANRARSIAKVLAGVTPINARVLLVAFGSGTDTPSETLAAVAGETTECVEEHRRARSTRPLGEWMLRLAKAAREGRDTGRRSLWVRMHAAAEGRLECALEEYMRQRGAG